MTNNSNSKIINMKRKPDQTSTAGYVKDAIQRSSEHFKVAATKIHSERESRACTSRAAIHDMVKVLQKSLQESATSLDDAAVLCSSSVHSEELDKSAMHLRLATKYLDEISSSMDLSKELAHWQKELAAELEPLDPPNEHYSNV